MQRGEVRGEGGGLGKGTRGGSVREGGQGYGGDDFEESLLSLSLSFSIYFYISIYLSIYRSYYLLPSLSRFLFSLPLSLSRSLSLFHPFTYVYLLSSSLSLFRLISLSHSPIHLILSSLPPCLPACLPPYLPPALPQSLSLSPTPPPSHLHNPAPRPLPGEGMLRGAVAAGRERASVPTWFPQNAQPRDAPRRSSGGDRGWR